MMKKYLQITIVLGVFFIAVLMRHFARSAFQLEALAQGRANTSNTQTFPPLPTESSGTSGSQSSTSHSAALLRELRALGEDHHGRELDDEHDKRDPTWALPVVTPTVQRAATNATPTPAPIQRSTAASQASGRYKDGTYTGAVANAYYGYMQVRVAIQGGRITGVTFLQHPDHARTSVRINDIVMPMLKREAIQAQSYRVNIISGASASSIGFIESLTSALQQAS